MGMPNPYPIELRERAVRAYVTGTDAHTVVAERFAVNPWTLLRWIGRQRTTGTVAPLPKGGGRLSPVEGGVLEAIVRDTPDATTEEITRVYNGRVPRGDRVHRSSILRALHRRGFVFKKNGRGRRNWIARTSKPSATRSSTGWRG